MRGTLIGLSLLCAALLFCTVRFASAPVYSAVAPLPVIETIWNIEDTHTEAEGPLLAALLYQGEPLPRDAEGTFYCPLGLERGEDWPEFDLRLTDAGVSCCFADDYAWDACGDAIASGTRYRLLCWTEESYAYQDIVFTGLPVITLQVGVDPLTLTDEDVPAEATYQSPEGALAAHARIHRRGASTFITTTPKRSYRVEFTKSQDGRKKIRQSVPGLGEMEALVLLPMNDDPQLLRDAVGWTLYNALSTPEEPFGARRFTYCELILNGDYQGVYLLLEPFQAAKELMKGGSAHAMRDCVYRTAALNFSRGRQYYKHPLRTNCGYELYYAPQGEDPFAALMPYLALIQTEDETAFTEGLEALVDTNSLLRHVLLTQACGWTDNVFNNMYIWADRTDGKLTYRFVPWDLDMSWGLKREDVGDEFEHWLYFPLADRAFDLNALGLRDRLLELWESQRAGMLSTENMQALLDGLAATLNDSGAMARNAERWEKDNYRSDPQELMDFYEKRIAILEEAMEDMRTIPGSVPFLAATEYQKKGGPIRDLVDYWSDEELEALSIEWRQNH